jgi:RNA polymerase sigma-70 factor, ECF subfamily
VNQRTLAGDYDLMIRTPDQIHDEWLVLRCQSGQVTALTELLQRWHERLLDYARHLLRDEADASDALQETFVAVARSIRRLDDPAHFGAWARRILAHKCADFILGNGATMSPWKPHKRSRGWTALLREWTLPLISNAATTTLLMR